MNRDEENKLRRLLFLGHHHGGRHAQVYGDDGEMQCAQCFCDFMRDPAEDLEKKILTFNISEYSRRKVGEL